MSIGWAHLLLIIGGILMPYTVLWPMSRLDRKHLRTVIIPVVSAMIMVSVVLMTADNYVVLTQWGDGSLRASTEGWAVLETMYALVCGCLCFVSIALRRSTRYFGNFLKYDNTIAGYPREIVTCTVLYILAFIGIKLCALCVFLHDSIRMDQDMIHIDGTVEIMLPIVLILSSSLLQNVQWRLLGIVLSMITVGAPAITSIVFQVWAILSAQDMPQAARDVYGVQLGIRVALALAVLGIILRAENKKLDKRRVQKNVA